MDKEQLEQIQNFVKVAMAEIEDLGQKLEQAEKRATVVSIRDHELKQAITKAADAMYDSDFITDREEKERFIKKASEDPSFLARSLEKVCKAADVAYMGKPSTVKTAGVSDDPVMRRAFGYDNNYSLLDE